MSSRVPAWFELNHPGHTVAEIVRLLAVEDWRSIDAADALSQIGEPALAAVLEALDDPAPGVREAGCYAVSALARGNPDWLVARGDELQQKLLPRLESPHDRLRRAACGAAGALGSAPAATIDALRRNLSVESEDVRRVAALAMARLGAWSSEVSDALHRAMRDPAWTVRWAAAQVVAEHEPSPAVEDTLRALLAEPMNEIWLLECRQLMARHGWLRPEDDRPAPFPAGGGVVRWLGGR